MGAYGEMHFSLSFLASMYYALLFCIDEGITHPGDQRPIWLILNTNYEYALSAPIQSCSKTWKKFTFGFCAHEAVIIF